LSKNIQRLFRVIETYPLTALPVGSTVFRGKFCQIPQASSRNSAVHCGKIVQIPRPPIYDWKLRELFRTFSYWKLALY